MTAHSEHPGSPETSSAPVHPLRANQRFLGLLNMHARPDEQAAPPTGITLSDDAHQVLLAHLQLPGTARSGPLFGTRSEGLVRVTHAARGGSVCLSPGLETPFVLDPRYVLGWSDCLSIYGRVAVDWVGHWLIAPDNLLGAPASHQRWVQQARQAALLDDEHFLLLLGLGVDRVDCAAYLGSEGQNLVLPTPFSLASTR